MDRAAPSSIVPHLRSVKLWRNHGKSRVRLRRIPRPPRGVSVIGRLAKDEKAFREAYEAFRSGKAKEFQAILKRLGLFPRCRVVCEWIRIKECIFLCLELCGPPKPYKEVPNPRLLAEAIVRITSNEKLVHELVEVLEKRNRDAFERIVNEYKLGPLCHLFCHWLCVVRFRLICRWVCSPIQIERPNLADELRLAGQALRRLLEHKDAFDRAVAASNAGDAEKLAEVIRGADLIPFCYGNPTATSSSLSRLSIRGERRHLAARFKKETFLDFARSNSPDTVPVVTSVAADCAQNRTAAPKRRRWLLVRVSIQATRQEMSLITQAARKLRMTAQQFVARTATNPGAKRKTREASVRHEPSAKRKPRRPRPKS